VAPGGGDRPTKRHLRTGASGALGAWRHVSPARRSGSVLRLATQEQRQAILQR